MGGSYPYRWRGCQYCRMRRRNSAHWRLIGRGQAIYWPDIDEDVSVESLLRRV
ncbi:MAG TPA: DUF2442 domain-containing protein [Acetobacteraceae bacterium]|nr:DUF2442 domain-containing protein [Acetobacteraceae bacterium]